jgi:glycerophosphoryl diester phosphodiesterase
VPPLIIAHRGASAEAVENSLQAFRLARERGADAVELDVHATADGALVVHHDEMVGPHHVAHCSLREIRERQLPNGEPIPTLAEALGAVHPALWAFVEIKSLAPRWDERLFAAFDASPAPARIAVHGFDHRIVRRLGEERPHLRRGVLSASYPVQPVRMLEDADASVLWQEARYVDRALVEAVHDAGMTIHVWTVDDSAAMERMVELGVDGLCTNHPDRARAVLGARVR